MTENLKFDPPDRDKPRQLKLGRLPRDFSKPALEFENYMAGGGLPAAPPEVDWLAKVPSWPMYGNDQYGDCVWAMIGHMIQAWSAYAGTEVDVPLGELLAGYSAVTGFDPATGANDSGTVIQDALKYWQQTGIKDATGKVHKLAGYAAMRVPHNTTLMKQVVNTFGTVALGVSFPQSAMDQFNAGQPWTYVPGSPNIGGHAYTRQRIAGGGMNVYSDITWGQAQRENLAFNKAYTEEAWVCVSEDWIDANGTTVEGLNLQQLLADMASV